MKKITVFFLLLAMTFIIFQHCYYFTELYYDRDLAGYAYNTLDVLRGKGWYYSAWHPKPPGINLIILAAFNLFGNSFKSIYLAALFFNLLSVSLLYLFAKSILSKETKFYFLLPLFFALFFTSEPFKSYSANTEVFLATFEIAGMLFLGLNQCFISGLLLGTGFLIRQSGMHTFIAGFFFIIALKITHKTSYKTIIKNLFIFFIAFILPLVLVSLYFLYKGVFDKFLDYTFIYNIRHIGEYVIDVRKRDLPITNKVFWDNLNFEIILFGILSLIGLFQTIFRRTEARLLISLWFLTVCLGLSVSAIYRHHFIQLIVPLACISLLGVSDAFEAIKRVFERKIYLKNILILALTVVLFIPYIRLIIPFVTKKRPYSYAYGAKEKFLAAQYIKEHTTPQDKIFVWDNFDAGVILLWSERESITRFRDKYAFLPAELREYWIPYIKDYQLNQKQLISGIKQERPKYIIVVPDFGTVIDDAGIILTKTKDIALEKNAFPEFFGILDEDYRLEKEAKMYPICLYRRKI